ncbi:MAG: TIGR03668 family PPOX class F420-dependent oxidoreductase [Actinomycetota bacterium]|nr:TIGR03668 family PPOX class F420-dependent oxidoreductase [Actinomycetota bacterium]
MTAAEARARFAAARVARLATASRDGRPHLVPFTFALLGDATIVSAVDAKPKRTTALRRLANIAANPSVAALVDHYSDDWDELWWVRVEGTARVIGTDQDPALRGEALNALSARYQPYREQAPAGALIVISVERWSGWSAA